MAKLEQTIYGDFDQVLHRIENGILNGSMSASLENSSDFVSGTARCSVRVFERYSTIGSNRVSLAVTLFQTETQSIFPPSHPAEVRPCFSKSTPGAKKLFSTNCGKSCKQQRPLFQK